MDRNLLAADLSEADSARLSSIIDDSQIRNSIRLYAALSQLCFSDCVNTFYRKSLGKQEEMCVRRCTEKFIRLSLGVSTSIVQFNQDASKQ